MSFDTNIVHALLASLTGDRNRIAEMSPSIRPEHLPQSMAFEKKYLTVLWEIFNSQGVPTREAVILALMTRFPDLQDIESLVDNVIQKRPETPHVGSLSFFLGDWINQRVIETGLKEAMSVMAKPEGLAAERFQEAVEKVNARLLNSRTERRLSTVQAIDVFFTALTKLAQRRKIGLSAGAVLPYKSIMEIIPTLVPGEITLITAKTGRGKSTLALDIAEKNAHEYDVPALYLSYETSLERLVQRMAAKHLLIPTRHMQAGLIDPREDPWKTVFEKWRSEILQNETEKSPMFWQHCPGWTNHQLENAVYLFTELLQSWGKPGIVVVDYLQKMPHHSGLDTRESTEANAEIIKVLAERYAVPVVLFSQEIDSGEGIRAYGSQAPQHKAQLHISLVRSEATSDLPVRNSKNEIALDAVGQQRFWHKKGDYAANASLKIVKNNNESLGTFPILFENAYFRVV